MNEPIFSTADAVIDPSECLTDAWLAFVHDHKVEPLRDQIDAMVCRLLRPHCLGGFFDGFFDCIVREAVQLALARFLPENKALISATQSGNRCEINAQLMRSIWLALQATIWQARTLATKVASHEIPYYNRLHQAVAKLDHRTAN